MPGEAITIRSRDGGEFACHLVTPNTGGRVPAVVLASTVHGVDADLRAIADEFAAHGFIAAAPDLFWRRPDSPHEERVSPRSKSRLEWIESGEDDMADTLAHLRTLEMFNGRAAAMGFCYGGPYAILGPKRLGYAAGISCHGSEMLDYIHDLEGVGAPVCIIWGDRDHRAPAGILDAYRDLPPRMENVEVHVLPGVLHGYMMRGRPDAFDAAAHGFSMARALAILDGLRCGAVSQPPGPKASYETELRMRHAQRPGFRIAELRISPAQQVPWHYHTVVQDTFYVLEGTLRLFLRDPAEEVVLAPGETYAVRPRRAHLVTNAGNVSATFLVLQGLGEHDFVPLAT